MASVILPSGKETPVSAVLFDNDGTLVDTHDLLLTSFQYATKEVLGEVFSEEMYMKGVGTPLADQMFDFTDDPAEAKELLSVYRKYNKSIHDRMIKPFEGMDQALAQLKDAGLRLGVVTSKLHSLAWHGLEVTGLSSYFDFLIGPDDFPEHKPEPGPVLEGCRRMGFDPANCVYVGDSPFDIHSGNGAGTTTIAVLWGMFTREKLAVENPDIYCETVSDLVKAFNL